METTEIIYIMSNPGLASTFLVFLVRLDFRLFRTDVTHVRKVRNDRHAPDKSPCRSTKCSGCRSSLINRS